MTQQQALWHDTVYDALATDIAAIGGPKKAAAMLWPNNSSAYDRMRACLNPTHSQKFDPEEILAIKRLARDAGSTATVQFEDQYLGKRTEWMAPEDEHARLQREFIDMGKRMEQLAAQIARNGSRLKGVA